MWNSFSYLCTRALHSFWSFAHCCSASNIIPLLYKATFTPFIQPDHSLPRTHPPLTSAINTLLAIRYSSKSKYNNNKYNIIVLHEILKEYGEIHWTNKKWTWKSNNEKSPILSRMLLMSFLHIVGGEYTLLTIVVNALIKYI